MQKEKEFCDTILEIILKLIQIQLIQFISSLGMNVLPNTDKPTTNLTTEAEW